MYLFQGTLDIDIFHLNSISKIIIFTESNDVKFEFMNSTVEVIVIA